MQKNPRDKIVLHEQDLSKMTQDELIDIVDKDFHRLWNDLVNKQDNFESLQAKSDARKSNY